MAYVSDATIMALGALIERNSSALRDFMNSVDDAEPLQRLLDELSLPSYQTSLPAVKIHLRLRGAPGAVIPTSPPVAQIRLRLRGVGITTTFDVLRVPTRLPLVVSTPVKTSALVASNVHTATSTAVVASTAHTATSTALVTTPGLSISEWRRPVLTVVPAELCCPVLFTVCFAWLVSSGAIKGESSSAVTKTASEHASNVAVRMKGSASKEEQEVALKALKEDKRAGTSKRKEAMKPLRETVDKSKAGDLADEDAFQRWALTHVWFAYFKAVQAVDKDGCATAAFKRLCASASVPPGVAAAIHAAGYATGHADGHAEGRIDGAMAGRAEGLIEGGKAAGASFVAAAPAARQLVAETISAAAEVVNRQAMERQEAAAELVNRQAMERQEAGEQRIAEAIGRSAEAVGKQVSESSEAMQQAVSGAKTAVVKSVADVSAMHIATGEQLDAMANQMVNIQRDGVQVLQAQVGLGDAINRQQVAIEQLAKQPSESAVRRSTSSSRRHATNENARPAQQQQQQQQQGNHPIWRP